MTERERERKRRRVRVTQRERENEREKNMRTKATERNIVYTIGNDEKTKRCCVC